MSLRPLIQISFDGSEYLVLVKYKSHFVTDQYRTYFKWKMLDWINKFYQNGIIVSRFDQ